MSSPAEVEATHASDTLGGHPRGLYVLFGAEMWERFSYYGMRALLVLYLTKHLAMDRADALEIYALYTGLVYLTPLLGGFLADQVLGQRKAILIGGIVMAMGHFAMAFEPLLYLALGLLILGNGFFKPNISTMVGTLYPQDDPRRDAAYTIFYMGINLGAFFSPLVCGTLGESERFGWHYGFGAAGVGMILGLITFVAMQGTLGTAGYPPGRTDHRLRAMDYLHVAVISLLCLGFAYAAIETWPTVRPAWRPGRLVGVGLIGYQAVVLGVVAAAIVGLTRLIPTAKPARLTAAEEEFQGPAVGEVDKPFTGVEWQRIAVILVVAVFSIVFWMGFEQAGGTLNLFADNKTDRHLFSREFPASWFQSINPLLILGLAPLFSALWIGLERKRIHLPSSAKMGIGLILLGLGFVVMSAADKQAAGDTRVGPQWLSGVYLLFTMGELCLSPIGLSLVNKLAPAQVASLMMAVWFLCTAAANYLAGTLEAMLEETDFNLWTFLIATSVIPGVLLLALTPLLKKMGHGRL